MSSGITLRTLQGRKEEWIWTCTSQGRNWHILNEKLQGQQEDKLVEMMQAFNKKLEDLQKDLQKVKRNQAGTQRNTRISDIKKDTECFKCGQKGHWKRECNEQQRRRPQTEETPIKYAARHCTPGGNIGVTRNVRTWELILLTRRQECTSTWR